MTFLLHKPQPAETVSIEHEITDALDHLFSSPIDGAIAVAQLRNELVAVHNVNRMYRLFPGKNLLRLCRGRFIWMDAGFSYVQHGTTLHVIDVWRDWHQDGRRLGKEVDVVLSSPKDGSYVEETSAGEGVSIVSIG
ncbi:MAG: hypothetical protein ACREJD_02995 [Phycisphaerales bacterium]